MAVGIYIAICGCTCTYYVETKRILLVNCCEKHKSFRYDEISDLELLLSIQKDNNELLKNKLK